MAASGTWPWTWSVQAVGGAGTSSRGSAKRSRPWADAVASARRTFRSWTTISPGTSPYCIARATDAGTAASLMTTGRAACAAPAPSR